LRFRSLAISMMTVVALAPVCADEMPPALYEADFEGQADGTLPAGWTAFGGAWVTATDDTAVLQQSEPGFRGLAMAGRPWSNYDVVATVRLLAGADPAGVGLVGYWAPSGGCYRFNSYGNLLALWREADGKVQALAATPFELKPEQAYVFRLSLRTEGLGTRLAGRVWLAGEPEPGEWTLTALDAAVPLQHGRPGLFTGRSSAAFSDLTVTAATGEVIAADRLSGGTSPGGRQWQYGGGSWQAPAGDQPLVQTAVGDDQTFGAAAYAILGGWGNCTVQALAKAAQGSRNQGFGLAAYWQEDNSCYQFGQLANSSLFLARRTPMGPVTLATVPFGVDQGAWYALKLRVDERADGVVLRGKIWPAHAGEPTEWQIEAQDTRLPPLHGGDVAVWCLDDVCSFDELSLRGNR
jgi:hypothetical protein